MLVAAPASAASSPDVDDLNARLAKTGVALDLAARLATAGYAARGCSGDACDRAMEMLPVAGAVLAAASSREQRPLGIALAALEAAGLTLAALDVCDSWSDRHGRVRIGLRGPGLVVAADF